MRIAELPLTPALSPVGERENKIENVFSPRERIELRGA